MANFEDLVNDSPSDAILYDIARVKSLATIAFTVQKFVEMLSKEVGKVGYTSLEFLANLELFLQCVTPRYKRPQYEELLRVLEEVNPLFKKSLFCFSLNCLREILCRDLSTLPVSPLQYEIPEALLKDFVLYLIETIVLECRTLRRFHATRNKGVEEVQETIQNKFRGIVLEAIAKQQSADSSHL